MKNYNWLKAGLLAAAVSVTLQFLGLIPCVNCLICPFTCVAWFVVPFGSGFLAATWARLKRDQFQEAAVQGALSGLTLGIISGIGTIVIQLISSLLDLSTQTLSSLAEENESYLSSFITVPVGLGGALFCGSVACFIGIILDVIFSILGSIIKVAMSKE
jgi:hypothetical protein